MQRCTKQERLQHERTGRLECAVLRRRRGIRADRRRTGHDVSATGRGRNARAELEVPRPTAAHTGQSGHRNQRGQKCKEVSAFSHNLLDTFTPGLVADFIAIHKHFPFLAPFPMLQRQQRTGIRFYGRGSRANDARSTAAVEDHHQKEAGQLRQRTGHDQKEQTGGAIVATAVLWRFSPLPTPHHPLALSHFRCG